MKLSNSIKAFIISFLLTGNLALLLWGYQIKNGIAKPKEEAYDIVYNQEILEELLAQQEGAQNKPIETHKAFNQTQKKIAQTKVQSTTDANEFKKRLAALDDAIKDVKKAKDERISTESTFTPSKKSEAQESNIENSTNSFRLLDRKALYFPNPVYTCEVAGTVVVNITVDNNGLVKDQAINESASTTNNQCLWDMALEYASKAQFNESSRPTQLGTITYRFPGQN